MIRTCSVDSGKDLDLGAQQSIRAANSDSGNRASVANPAFGHGSLIRANLGKRAIGRRMLIRTSRKRIRGVLPESVRIKLEVRIKSNAKTIGRQVQTAAAQITSRYSCKVIGQSGVGLPGCQNHYQAPSLKFTGNWFLCSSSSGSHEANTKPYFSNPSFFTQAKQL